MTARVLTLVFALLFTMSSTVLASSDYVPAGPIAHTPDAESVIQSGLSQTSNTSAPTRIVFTEYTFADDEMALNYFSGICAYLETEMQSISPEGMANLNLRQEGNPKCGFAREKKTQAYGAIVHENRVLTIWVFGLGIQDDAGMFLRIYMHSSSPIQDEAILPDPKTVGAPWKVRMNEMNQDITEYAQTSYDLRDQD